MAIRDRLDKLLGMLGSSNDGERATAALFIFQTAVKERLTIVQLMEREFGYRPPEPASRGTSNVKRRWNAPTMQREEMHFDFDETGSPLLDALRWIRIHAAITKEERSTIATILSRCNTDRDMSPKLRAQAETIIAKHKVDEPTD